MDYHLSVHSKYNRLLEIEEELGVSAEYLGRTLFRK
jgi:enolase